MKKAVSSELQSILWISAEEVCDNVIDLTKEIGLDNSSIICVMVSKSELKEKVLKAISALNMDSFKVLDVYKAYMSRLPLMRYQRIMNRRRGEKLDGLILGITHAMVGIIEEKMPGKVCNLCESSQDIYFNYKVLENIYNEYYESINELKYVVIDMFDYTYFNFDTLMTGAYDLFLEESGFLCEERCNWNKAQLPQQINDILQARWQEGRTTEQQELLDTIFPNMREADDSIYKGYTVLKERKHVITEDEIKEYKNSPTVTSLQFRVFENTIEFQISNFEKILQILQKINPQMQVFLLLMPKCFEVEQSEKQYNERWKPFFSEIISEFQQQYPFIRLLDFKEFEVFSKNRSWYEDLSYFNYFGACKFTGFLAEVLSKEYNVLGMNIQNNWQEQAYNQLLDALDSGYINEDTISEYSYFHLVALLKIAQKLKNGREYYLKIKEYLENINISRLCKKEKIIVGFIANYSATWIGDELYRLFEKSERFEPYVFLISNHNIRDIELIKDEYTRNLKFFAARNMNIVQTLNLDTGEQYTWEEIGIKPEVCIWLTPWIDLFRGPYYLLNYSLDTLHTFITYGFRIAENKYSNFVYDQYNQIMHNITWKNFEESQNSVEMAGKYAFVGKSNAIYTGYPKMDVFLEEWKTQQGVWSVVLEKSGNKEAKKVIYAPHHTLEETDLLSFSTFASNYMFMLELAEKYREKTVWIFKPHPQLKYKAIKAGLFKNMGEWNDYVKKWKSMKNAEVMEEGTYENLFMHSDAMILDSVSFLVEYLYVHKPLLFLKREEQAFNEFGKKLMTVHYCAEGNDKTAIERFLQKVVLNNQDERKEIREEFFEENLNYTKLDGENAAHNIFAYLDSELRKRD